MSGRAGRRGYDSAGTVIFMALPTSKTRRLLTASLATLRGNAPYTTSFLLRLFDYVNGWKDQEKSITEAKEKFKKGKLVDTTDTLNTEVRIKAALTLLDNCFALYTKDEAKRAAFNRLLKYLTLFNVQLLRREQLLNAKCELTGFAQVATALSSFEPGNLVFVHILQKGEFHKLCKKYAEEPKKLQDTLILILAHIFTNKRLPISYDTGDDSNKPALKPMPDEFQTLVDEYNSNVDKLLLAFLQLATEKRHLQSPVFELTGKIKEDSLDTAHLDVVSPFDEDLILDEKLMPAAARTLYDHRGNKHVLIGIYSALFDVSKQRDKLLDVMREIADEYEDKFKKAFSMRSNIEETVTVEGKREKTKKWHRS
uniref:DDX60-like winged helix domain-containing protein n=1 Tax=Acrobeloides nanus TaxID=290746 RepID=A0A914C4F5_9BILA